MELNKSFTIRVENLSLEYHELIRKRKNPFGRIIPFQALKNMNFEIGKGETVALLGRNGAGKTTLLSCIAGQLRPSSGKIITDGRVIVLKGADPGLVTDLSGRQNVRELGSAYGVGDDEIGDLLRPWRSLQI